MVSYLSLRVEIGEQTQGWTQSRCCYSRYSVNFLDCFYAKSKQSEEDKNKKKTEQKFEGDMEIF